MNDLLYIVAVILVIGWLVGYIGFGEAVGNLIHLLLLLAVISVLFRLIGGKRL